MNGLHRLPPMRGRNAPLGTCRWCGEVIREGQRVRPARANWHLECLDVYKIAANAADARRALWKRDRGMCELCGLVDAQWQADHVTALCLVDRALPRKEQMWFWGLENLQTLCRSCHTQKTAEDVRRLKTKGTLGKDDEAVAGDSQLTLFEVAP